jgi:hypothetical protein
MQSKPKMSKIANKKTTKFLSKAKKHLLNLILRHKESSTKNYQRLASQNPQKSKIRKSTLLLAVNKWNKETLKLMVMESMNRIKKIERKS